MYTYHGNRQATFTQIWLIVRNIFTAYNTAITSYRYKLFEVLYFVSTKVRLIVLERFFLLPVICQEYTVCCKYIQ